MDYLSLLSQQESDFLDFKSQWHHTTAELVLDIMCMANSGAQQDRYLIIGYDEKKKQPYDVSQDPNRKNQEDVLDILKNAFFNRIPFFSVECFSVGEKILDIIIIKKSYNRPYFLLKDKTSTKKTNSQNDKKLIVRAGVPYTRTGRTNTPIDATPSEYEIANMWEERFGIKLSPLERFSLYIKDVHNWKSIQYSDTNILYYNQFPEFTVDLPNKDHDFLVTGYEWLPIPFKSYYNTVLLKYHSTILKTLQMVFVRARYFIYCPDWVDIYYKQDFSEIILVKFGASSPDNYNISTLCNPDQYLRKRIYYHIRQSLEFAVQNLYNTEYQLREFYNYYPQDPFKTVYVFDENQNIEQECKRIFLKAVKQKDIF